MDLFFATALHPLAAGVACHRALDGTADCLDCSLRMPHPVIVEKVCVAKPEAGAAWKRFLPPLI
jgi:hypothetical protein